MPEYILTQGTVSVIRHDLEGIEEAEARGYVLQGERPEASSDQQAEAKPKAKKKAAE